MPDIPIQVLLVEDDLHDLPRIADELRETFESLKIPAFIHECNNFEEAKRLSNDPSRHFDLIVSDTYKGPTVNRDAEVINLVNEYKKGKFTALVVMSSGVKPPELVEGPFLLWASKTPSTAIPNAIKTIMDTGIPQLSRRLHSEVNLSAGTFLWNFLEQKWAEITGSGTNHPIIVERLIRRRAAILIAELVYNNGKHDPIEHIAGLEYYIYPPIQNTGYQLGSVVRNKEIQTEFRVVLTPHCHLTVQKGKEKPRAEFVLTVKAVSAKDVIGLEKVGKLKDMAKEQRNKKLGNWSTPPSLQELGVPEGRFWFLPSFLDIPYLYCDFMQIESVAYAELGDKYETIATLSPPFAESLQSNFVAYYGSVGIAKLDPDSISTIGH